MELPSAVKRAADRSEAIQKQLKEGKPKDQGTTPVNGTPASSDTLPDKTVVQQTPAPDTPQQQKGDEETYKQRYFTLKGKFDAQVPRLQQDLRDLQHTVSDLQNKNTQLSEAANNQNNKDPVDVEALDPEAFASYGEEFETLVKTIQTLQTQNKSLADQVTRLSGDVTQDRETKAKKAYEGYINEVRQKVEAMNVNFDVLNNDPAFLNYLRQYPENEFEPRLAKLRRAEAAHDLIATIAIFKEYLGKSTPSNTPKPNVQPAPGNPGTDLNPPIPAQSTKIWTRAEISNFYKDKSNGKYAGREDEAKALEMDIFQAPRQGRIA